MIYKLMVSKAAVEDIDQAIDWYDAQLHGLGYEFETNLEAALQKLKKDPFLFQKKYKDIRVMYVKRFPYGIHFQINRSTIKVVALFHIKRNPIRWDNTSTRKDK